MRKLLIATSLLISNVALANGLSSDEHSKLLEAMVGPSKQVNINENRTFYFANSANQTIEIVNMKDNIYVSIQPSRKNDGLGFSLANNKSNKVNVIKRGDSDLAVKVDSEFEPTKGNREVLNAVLAHIGRYTKANIFGLSVNAVQSDYWKYDVSGPSVDTYAWKRLENPKMLNAIVQAPFILSLNETDIAEMGAKAVLRAKEKRSAGGGSCSIQSANLMKCEWSLRNERADDTLRGFFSIKAGKIQTLLKIEMEWGC